MDIFEERIVSLFKSKYNEKITKIDLLPGAGSSRRYYRIFSELPYTILACFGTNIEENETFTYFSSKFIESNINVPQVIAVDSTHELYFISDLGETDVLHVKENLTEIEIISLYKRILLDLIQIQLKGGEVIDFTKCFVRPEFDRTAMQWDLCYFKYYYLKISGLEFNEQKLEVDFCTLLDFLESAPRNYFMYRDFQSRNILLKNNQLGYIDFQGGMKGPLQYDVVSLLYQAKANLSENMRNELLDFYVENLQKEININKDEFIQQFQGFVFIRILQTLGAYGFRGLIQGKEHFIQSIPQALANLKQHVPTIASIINIPYLKKLIEELPEIK